MNEYTTRLILTNNDITLNAASFQDAEALLLSVLAKEYPDWTFEYTPLQQVAPIQVEASSYTSMQSLLQQRDTEDINSESGYTSYIPSPQPTPGYVRFAR